MARRLGICLLVSATALVATNLPGERRQALAREAEMDAKSEAQAKEAIRLYKQGRYEEAADIFAKLSVDYPNMLVFERNLGACFYYLRRPEPALSNLRHYLFRKRDIEPEDRATVERWISEMEKLREQNAAPPPAQPPPSETAAPAPAPSPPAAEPPAPPPPPSLAPVLPPPQPVASPAPALPIPAPEPQVSFPQAGEVAPTQAPAPVPEALAASSPEPLVASPPLTMAVPRQEPAPEPASESHSHRGWAVASFVVGAIGLGIGTVTGIMLLSKKSDLDKSGACDTSSKQCNSSQHDLIDSYNSLRPVSTVGFIVGLVGVGAGITLLATEPAKGGASLAATIGPGTLSLQGAF